MRRYNLCLLLLAAGFNALVAGPALAGIVTLENGVRVEGQMGKIFSLVEDPNNPSPNAQVKQIVLLDDGLRRVFLSSMQVRAVAESPPTPTERIRIKQPVMDAGRRIGGVGPAIAVEPFDPWGRRIYTMNTAKGPIHVIQGITEITPTYTKVEGLMGRYGYVWDMRMATSSIPRETLSRILLQNADDEDPSAHLNIVRLYMQSDRFQDARIELERAIKKFPELADLKMQVTELRQRRAQVAIDEIKLRHEVGQYRLAFEMAKGFPQEGVAGVTLLSVRDLLQEYAKVSQQQEKVIQQLDQHVAQVEDAKLQARLTPIVREIKEELNATTLNRMADYVRLADDPEMQVGQKVALAISGWLLGSGEGIDNLAVAVALPEVRDLVVRYLRSTRPAERNEILERLRGLEGGDPTHVAQILAHMKPPIRTESPPAEQGKPAIPGLYTLTTPGLTGDEDVRYLIQLPPEYDPYRRYPCVVALHGSGTSPGQQIDWWAGGYHEPLGMRLGHGTRHGVIVIAPLWTRPHQSEYDFSVREHSVVLHSLRDACRRFSIDTDRVFLSGHSMGANAAWDIGLAHPDLWAGVIPIAPSASKYIQRYWENARHNLGMYFVCGQLDGNRMSINGPEWDRYFTRHGFDCMVTEYLGRGHDPFHDEILRIFEWMNKHERDFAPREFKCVSLRPWDNFFWWAELSEFPERGMVLPAAWPPPARAIPIPTEGRMVERNKLSLRTGAKSVTIYLSPETADFKQRVTLTLNGRSKSIDPQPDTEVMLEDVRTRGDRQHPFWAKVQFP